MPSSYKAGWSGESQHSLHIYLREPPTQREDNNMLTNHSPSIKATSQQLSCRVIGWNPLSLGCVFPKQFAPLLRPPSNSCQLTIIPLPFGITHPRVTQLPPSQIQLKTPLVSAVPPPPTVLDRRFHQKSQHRQGHHCHSPSWTLGRKMPRELINPTNLELAEQEH